MSSWRAYLLLALLLAGELTVSQAASSKDKGSSKKGKSPPYKYIWKGPRKRPPPKAVGPPPAPPKPTNGVCSTYVVQSGDTAMSVSQAQGVNYEDMVSALQECIGFQEGDFLQVGQAICLPPYTPACKFVQSVSGNTACKEYNVQIGDTLQSIASTFGIYSQYLEELNKDTITPGQPLSAGTQLRLPPWDEKTCKDSGSPGQSCKVYKVAAGESIYSIASEFKTTVDAILAVNIGLTANSPLQPSQLIKIPPFPTECGAGTLVSGPPVGDLSSCRAYIVQPGESLNSVALKYGLTAKDVANLNNHLTNPEQVAPGTRIKLPPWDGSCPENGTVINTPSGLPTPTSQQIPSPTAPPTGQQVAVNASAAPPPTPSVKIDYSYSPNLIAPAPSMPARVIQKSKVEMVLAGVSAAEFPSKQATIISILAQAAGVPEQDVTIMFALPVLRSSRRLMSSSDAVKVQSIVAGDARAVQANITASAQSGALQSAFQSEGLTLEELTYISPSGMATQVTVSPTTVPNTLPSSSNPSTLPIGIIIGAGAGGLAVIVLIVVVGCMVSKRRKAKKLLQEAKAASKSRRRGSGGVNAYVTLSGSKSYSKERSYDLDSRSHSPSRTTPRITTQPDGYESNYGGDGGGFRATPRAHSASRARSRNTERRTPRISSRASDDAESLAMVEVTIPSSSRSPPTQVPPHPSGAPVPEVMVHDPSPEPVPIVAAAPHHPSSPDPSLVIPVVVSPVHVSPEAAIRMSSSNPSRANAVAVSTTSSSTILEAQHPCTIPVVVETPRGLIAPTPPTQRSSIEEQRRSSKSSVSGVSPTQRRPGVRVAGPALAKGTAPKITTRPSESMTVVSRVPRAVSTATSPPTRSPVRKSPPVAPRSVPRVGTLGAERSEASCPPSKVAAVASSTVASQHTTFAASERRYSAGASPPRGTRSQPQRAPLTGGQRTHAPGAVLSTHREPIVAFSRTAVPVTATSPLARQQSSLSSPKRAPSGSVERRGSATGPQRSPTRSPTRNPTRAPPLKGGSSLQSYAEF